MTSYPAGGLAAYEQEQTATDVQMRLQTLRFRQKPPNCLFSLKQTIETSAESVAAFFDSCPCKVSNSWQQHSLRSAGELSAGEELFQRDGWI